MACRWHASFLEKKKGEENKHGGTTRMRNSIYYREHGREGLLFRCCRGQSLDRRYKKRTRTKNPIPQKPTSKPATALKKESSKEGHERINNRKLSLKGSADPAEQHALLESMEKPEMKKVGLGAAIFFTLVNNFFGFLLYWNLLMKISGRGLERRLINLLTQGGL